LTTKELGFTPDHRHSGRPQRGRTSFDPSTIGRILKVTGDNQRSYAQVTMPVGLLFTHGQLYGGDRVIAP